MSRSLFQINWHLVDLFPKEWTIFMKDPRWHTSPSVDNVNACIGGAMVDDVSVSPKTFYNELKRKKETVPSAQRKISFKYPDL